MDGTGGRKQQPHSFKKTFSLFTFCFVSSTGPSHIQFNLTKTITKTQRTDLDPSESSYLRFAEVTSERRSQKICQHHQFTLETFPVGRPSLDSPPELHHPNLPLSPPSSCPGREERQAQSGSFCRFFSRTTEHYFNYSFKNNNDDKTMKHFQMCKETKQKS